MRPKILTLGCVALMLAACSNDSASPLPDPANSDGPDEVTVPGLPDVGDTTPPSGAVDPNDYCHVDITGDITASFDSGGGVYALAYGAWVPESAVTVPGLPLDDSYFIMNCSGPAGELITISLGTDQRLPMAPASYPIRRADNIFGGYDSNPPVIQVSPFIGSGDFFWAVSADSVFNITEFDADHIAGNFQFFVAEAKGGILDDGIPAQNAVITGTFNLRNPN